MNEYQPFEDDELTTEGQEYAAKGIAQLEFALSCTAEYISHAVAEGLLKIDAELAELGVG